MNKQRTNRRRGGLRMVFLAAVLGASATATAQATQEATAPAELNQPQLIASGLDKAGGKITLTVNQSRMIHTTAPIRTVDVPDKEMLVVYVPSPTEIMITARKSGSTQLVIWDDRGHSQSVDVLVNADLSALGDELNKVLPDTKIDVSMANGTIVLRGRVPNAHLAEQIVQIATPYSGSSKIVNLLELGGGQQVMLQVRFAEVSKDAIDALGVNFGIISQGGFGASIIGPVANFGVVPSKAFPDQVLLGVPSPSGNVTAFGQFTSGKTPFDVFVTALRQNNLLRVLAEPNLTVISGNEASFMAGGEYPYPVPQNSGAGTGGTTITLDYKPYGVRLKFTPIVLGDGRIRLHVRPEVSDLDYTNALQLNGFTIPGLTTRTADTTVEMTEGQTLSLAGLLNQRANATKQVTPILGDIPILGALFRSVRYERSETELVVLVTPRLVHPMNPDQTPEAVGERWRFPTEPQLFLKADLGGPAVDASRTPAAAAPRAFQGTYGFAPANAVANSGK